jgi:hypothetical protein
MTDRITHIEFDGDLSRGTKEKLLALRHVAFIQYVAPVTVVLLDAPVREDDFEPTLKVIRRITKKTPKVVILKGSEWPSLHEMTAMTWTLEPQRKVDESMVDFVKRLRTFMWIEKAVREAVDAEKAKHSKMR